MDYFSKNYKIISLGYNCNIKIYTLNIGIAQETNLFDWAGTSMWAINKLFENDFSNLFNIKEYCEMKILKNDSGPIKTNKRYYIRLKHEFNKIKEKNILPINSKDTNKFLLINNTKKQTDIEINFNIFKSTYERRIFRLKKILNEEKNILFIRLEESMKNRIIYDEYKDNFKKSELEHIKDYSKIIKLQYPNLNFKIIYISKLNKTDLIKEFNLLILNTDTDKINWTNCADKLKELFDINIALLKEFK
jgi:hypothetical protein